MISGPWAYASEETFRNFTNSGGNFKAIPGGLL